MGAPRLRGAFFAFNDRFWCVRDKKTPGFLAGRLNFVVNGSEGYSSPPPTPPVIGSALSPSPSPPPVVSSHKCVETTLGKD